MFISAKVATWCAIVVFISPVLFSGMPTKECNKPMVLQPKSQTLTVWRIYLRLPHKLPKCRSFFCCTIHYIECLKNGFLCFFSPKKTHFALKTFGRREKNIRLFFFLGSNKRGSNERPKKDLDSEVVRWKIPVSIGFPISFLEHNCKKKTGRWRDELYNPYIPAGTEFWGVSQHLSPIHSLKLTAQNAPLGKLGQTCPKKEGC